MSSSHALLSHKAQSAILFDSMITTAEIKSKLIAFWTALSLPERLGVIIILQFAIIAPLTTIGGVDFYTSFQEATITGEYGVDTWNPYPAYWLLAPFAHLPAPLGFLLWNLLCAVGFLAAIHRFNGRYLPFALSLPCFWLFMVGQFEGIAALGMVLGFAANPLLGGLGIALLTLKPQLGLLPILFILFHRRDWRLLIVPTAVYAASLLHWGWWIPEWVASMGRNHASNYPANISLWPYSLALLPLLWIRRDSLPVWLLVQSLIMPYFAVYSLAVLFVMWLPTWANIAVWGLYLTAIFVPVQMPGYLIALGLLGQLIFLGMQERQPVMVVRSGD